MSAMFNSLTHDSSNSGIYKDSIFLSFCLNFKASLGFREFIKIDRRIINTISL